MGTILLTDELLIEYPKSLFNPHKKQCEQMAWVVSATGWQSFDEHLALSCSCIVGSDI